MDVCDCCGTASENTLLCLECNKVLCRSCDAHVHKLKMFMSHERFLASSKGFLSGVCPSHPSETVSCMCLSCNEGCCSFCIETETRHVGHNVVGLKAFCDNHAEGLESKSLSFLLKSILKAEKSFERLSKSAESLAQSYNNASELYVTRDSDARTLEDGFIGGFYGVYNKLVCILGAAEKAHVLEGETREKLIECANKTTVFVENGKIQVRAEAGLVVCDAKRSKSGSKNISVSFYWEMPSVLKVIEIKDSDVSYSVEVFDAKKAAWEKLPSNGARSYTLKDFDPSEVYKFRLSITIAPADDLKVYTILSEEYHHKFEAGMLEAKEPQDVTIKKHLCQKQDAPVKAEPQKVKRGKEYEDISYLTNGPNVYDGLLRSGPNYSVQSNGTLYVKSGSDGWNGHGLCNKPISNKCTTMWYVHVVRTSVSWCVIGLLAEDYKRSSSNSMWGLSFHNSSIVSGSPDSIKNIRPFSNRYVLRNGAVACFKADLVAQKLLVSFSEDFNNYYTIADNLPRDRPLVPFVMAFNQGDTIEFLNDASKASNEREERRFPSFLRRSGSSRSKEIEEYLASLSKSPRELSKLFDVFENSPENDNENRSENENGSDGENENAGNESDDGDRNEPQRKAPPDEKSEKGAQCKIQ